jgi:hypothetical protein
MTTRSLIDALKGQPFVLALVVMSVLNLAGFFILWREQQTRNAEVIRELIQHCVIERER